MIAPLPDATAARSLVRLRVKLPHGDFEAHAMAVHVSPADGTRGPGVGVQFWGLAGPGRLAWEGFIQGLLQTRRAAAKKNATDSIPPPSDNAPFIDSEGSRDGMPSGIRIAPIVDLASDADGDAASASVGPKRDVG